jgi:hypothetical protein
MTPLNHLMDALFECGPGDTNVAASSEVTMLWKDFLHAVYGHLAKAVSLMWRGKR